MRRRTLWIGVSVVAVAAVALGLTARGRGEKSLEVQTAKAARKEIDRWVSDRTHGHLGELFPPGSMST